MTSEHQSVYARTHELHGDVLAFVLEPEIEALQAHARLVVDGRAGRTLVKEGALRVTLVALRRGSRLEPHSVAGPVLVHGLNGVSRVTTGRGEVELGPGTFVALDEGVAHAVQAVEDCALLIVIALKLEPGPSPTGTELEQDRRPAEEAPGAAPALFPCMRALAAGEIAVLAGSTVYCPACYETASAIWPFLTRGAEPFELTRGLTCGGGHAED